MSRAWSFFAISLAVAAPLGAAVIREKTVTIAIEGDHYTETTHMVVRLESQDDVLSWSAYPVYVDEHRSLLSFEARSSVPDRGHMRAGRARRDRSEVSEEGILHDSASYELVRFEDLRPGAILNITHSVSVRPYYPSGTVLLLGDDPVDALVVELRGGGADRRWTVEGDAAVASDDSADRLVLTGYDLSPSEREAYAPANSGTVLRFAWGDDATWEGVGRWYTRLLDQVEPASPDLVAQARRLLGGVEDRRARFEALVRFVRKEIRYVGIEVGVGGYRPTPASVTLERRWGDCKDKSLLLINLLAEADIDAYPALIRLDARSRIGTAFPSPGAFNHLIVAVTEGAVPTLADDPVAGGYFFVDPTQADGGSRWLHAGVQDQDALVVRDGLGVLVHTPTLPGDSLRRLTLDLEVDAVGTARGQVALTVSGSLAAALAARAESVPRSELSGDLRGLLDGWLSSAAVESLTLDLAEAAVPQAVVRADVTFERLVQGQGTRLSFLVSGPVATPDPADVEADRDTPMVVRPRRAESTWTLRFPGEGCPAVARDIAQRNDLGSFSESVRSEGSKVVVERRSELALRWIEGEKIALLRELALAEHRAGRRRVRLSCTEAGDG